MNNLKSFGRKFKHLVLKKNGIDEFQFSGNTSLDIKDDIKTKYGYSGALLEIFADNKSEEVHKWHHYIPIYDRYFSRFRGRKIRFLELGVSKGGSLQMWRKYFGDEAIIFGIDINKDCAIFNGKAGQVRIGSQADPEFLDSVVQEMGGVDIVLDDGSHQMNHIKTSLLHLFPKINYGGIYLIEDLHTSYWKNYGGGYNTKGNFFYFLFQIVDDMHNWYHKRGIKKLNISKDCSGIHIHDSIVIFDKDKNYKPVHSQNS